MSNSAPTFLAFRCVAYCTSEGYDYAGLQYGSQCICTNSGPQGTSDAGQCKYGCAGDNSVKMCGGLGYINIFHTDAHKTTIDDWGCGNTVQDTYYQKWYQDMGHCGITSGKQFFLCYIYNWMILSFYIRWTTPSTTASFRIWSV